MLVKYYHLREKFRHDVNKYYDTSNAKICSISNFQSFNLNTYTTLENQAVAMPIYRYDSFKN